MTDQHLVSVAQTFTGLPMDSLIAAPLNAATKANAAMAMTQTKFLLDTCFTKEDGGHNGSAQYKPIMIKMSLTRGVVTPTAGNQAPPALDHIETSFNLPMLTLIPLNSLAIDSVDIRFEMEVKSSYGEDSHHDTKKSDSEKGGLEGSLGFGAMSAKVTGSVSYSNADTSSFDSHYQKSNQAKYTLALHAKQLPLPQGVTTIIKFFSNAIEPAAMPKSTAHTQGHQSSDSTYSI